ncbi:unnamed protein product (macronuclear) [Paramecium tetraurelia]|uniref:Uncharacterized protein n=1 Tax=Paramecium tetraurelia TaxID=5888 RepID=A0CG76_PARTE|nr:uncharacterized protein GSPATT00038238001 [Paramecium tetraurelia]CAK69793.1 unnamed protein product [Paramecium tetraurelia]|eukprot:XP_001437190.1 hypothetical protein (macronuclear) [Paramecium tetraurelia strain d4-2]
MQQSYDCPICLSISVDPIQLSQCNHIFCSACIVDLLDYNNQSYKCPLCRQLYQKNEPLIINQELAKKIKESNPELYVQRQQQILQQQMMLPNQIKVSVVYGNLYEKIKNNDKNQHQWTLVVKMDYNKESDRVALKNFDINNMIESVTYQLHATFRPSVVTVKQAPFQLQRLGWGTFMIPFLIKFKKEYNIPNLTVDHYLSFQGNGSLQKQITKLDISNVKEYQEISEQQNQQQQLQQQQ